jgi:hypothetical protein
MQNTDYLFDDVEQQIFGCNPNKAQIKGLILKLRELQEELSGCKDSYTSDYNQGAVEAKNSAGDRLGEILQKYGVD